MEKTVKFSNLIKILNSINDGIQIVNVRGEFIFCNKRSAIIDDINIEDTIGRHITNVYPNLNINNSTLLKVIKTGNPIIDNEQNYLTYKGKKILTLNSTYPLYDKNRLIGAVEISNNLTKVKELSEKVVDLQNIVYGKEKQNKDDIKYYCFSDIITENEEMIIAKNLAKRVANTDINVLVCGKTGTGKELIVQAIHRKSSREKNSFIAQNCAALPSNLLEGILFGTTKGSFTGAVDRPGLFELADNGTLFLDEVNSMPLELQAKLLRALQSGYIRRVGATELTRVNVRVIAAINSEPIKEIEKGNLRRDLYYRLNTIQINLNELKDRRGDIDLLVKYFIKKFNKKFFKNVKGLNSDVRKVLNKYRWPGNVRELENIIEGIMSIINTEYITIKDIPKSIVNKAKNNLLMSKEFNLKQEMAKQEKAYIIKAFEKSNQNVTVASKFLGIPRQTLQYKLKKYKI